MIEDYKNEHPQLEVPTEFKNAWDTLEAHIPITQKCADLLGLLLTEEESALSWDTNKTYYFSNSLNFLSSELTGTRMASEALGRNMNVAYANGVSEDEIRKADTDMYSVIQKVVTHIRSTPELREKIQSAQPELTRVENALTNW